MSTAKSIGAHGRIDRLKADIEQQDRDIEFIAKQLADMRKQRRQTQAKLERAKDALIRELTNSNHRKGK